VPDILGSWLSSGRGKPRWVRDRHRLSFGYIGGIHEQPHTGWHAVRHARTRVVRCAGGTVACGRSALEGRAGCFRVPRLAVEDTRHDRLLVLLGHLDPSVRAWWWRLRRCWMGPPVRTARASRAGSGLTVPPVPSCGTAGSFRPNIANPQSIARRSVLGRPPRGGLRTVCRKVSADERLRPCTRDFKWENRDSVWSGPLPASYTALYPGPTPRFLSGGQSRSAWEALRLHGGGFS
jgi:hypothetical protein